LSHPADRLQRAAGTNTVSAQTQVSPFSERWTWVAKGIMT
jgi:hypothetical protein